MVFFLFIESCVQAQRTKRSQQVDYRPAFNKVFLLKFALYLNLEAG